MGTNAKSRSGLIVAAILVVVVVVGVFHKSIATWYVARSIVNAAGPEEEVDAFERMNKWGSTLTYGYSVVAKDKDGKSIEPWKTGEYDRVVVVQIRWKNGTVVERQVVNRNSLSYVFGE